MFHHHDDRRLLGALTRAELTYVEHGATRGPLPAGYHHVRHELVLGHGRAVFDRAADALAEWRMHAAAGMSVTPSAPVAAPGAVVALRLGPGVLSLLIPCRVVYTVDEPAERGFAYGTLPGHPETGEEAFLVRLRPDGEVRVVITAFSRPATLLTRAGGPLARAFQSYFTGRYARSLRRLARP